MEHTIGGEAVNIGDCPYDDCNGIVSVAVPDRTPAYTMIVCDECGRDVWYRCSRLDPKAWTREAFEAEHVIDREQGTVVPKVEVPADEPFRLAAKHLDVVFQAYSIRLLADVDEMLRCLSASAHRAARLVRDLRALQLAPYQRLRRQLIAKARGRNWRNV